MLAVSVPAEYEAEACPVDTCGGVVDVPKLTSYRVAPLELQVRVGDSIVASRSKGHFPGTDEIVAAVTSAWH